MFDQNEDIKRKIKQSRLFQYEVAAALSISEYTFCKWLRRPLNEERKQLVEKAIESLVRGGDLND